MKRKHTPGCYCCLTECSCQELSDYLAAQPGTITGYTPSTNWIQENACCWRRTYLKNTPNPEYVCEDVCVPDLYDMFLEPPPGTGYQKIDYNDCLRFGTQMEIERGWRIDLYIFQYNFGSSSQPWNSEPWNTACGPFDGCKIVVLSRYWDNVTQHTVTKGPYGLLCQLGFPAVVCGNTENAPCKTTPNDTYPCPAATTCQPPGTLDPPTAPCEVDGCDCITVIECGGADVDWWRIKVFDSVPSNQSLSFGSGDVTSCYCTDGVCNFPCSFGTSLVDFITENQCVELQRKVFNCQTPYQYIGGDPPFDFIGYEGCEGYTNFEHCFTPPAWTVNL